MLNLPRPTSVHWDIFCQVIDNYGDAGIAWRLCQQLAQHPQFQVRLWIDKIAVLASLCRAIDTKLLQQTIGLHNGKHSIMLYHWQNPVDKVANIVVNLFGCSLPPGYWRAMQQHNPKPLWYSLEYLSAETWVNHYHGLPSIKPKSGLVQHFFVPGFSQKSGGLLREPKLLIERNHWQADPQHRQALFESLEVPTHFANAHYVSVFCYPTAALKSLLRTWVKNKTPIIALMPSASAIKSVSGLFDQPLHTHQLLQYGALSLKILPFIDQALFTRLLWSCDSNIVRGEESFVSALWAAKPFIWHIYPQQRAAHLVKLQAFMDHFCLGWDKATRLMWQNLQQRFNQHQRVARCWHGFIKKHALLEKYARRWALQQAKEKDLVTQLIDDAQQKLMPNHWSS